MEKLTIPGLIISCVLLVAVGGCNTSMTPSDQSPAPAGHVDHVQLFVLPTAINMDDVPGPDGISIEIMFFQLSQGADGKVVNKTVPISGCVEVVMFDGQVRAGDIATASPLKVWRFAPGQIGPYLNRSALGYYYAMALPWGKNEPKATSVTVIVRYQPPNEQPMYSESLAVAVGPS